MSFRNRDSGFTIIELMIVIALVGVIAAFAIPQFGRVIDNNRIVSTTNSAVGLLNFARSEAVRRGASVGVTAAGNSMTAFLASDNSQIRQIEPAQGDLTISATTVTFRATGLTAGLANVTFNVCSGQGTGRQVTVSPGGTIVSADFACP